MPNPDTFPVDISQTLARIDRIREEARKEALRELGISEEDTMPLSIAQSNDARCLICGKPFAYGDDGEYACPDNAEHAVYAEDSQPEEEGDE